MVAIERAIQEGVADLARTVLKVSANSRVYDLEKLFVGMEADIYSFAVEAGSGKKRAVSHYVLKLFVGKSDEMARNEFETTSAVRQAGLQVARPISLGTADSVFSRPVILMERVDGTTLKAAYYAASEEGKEQLLSLFCKEFVSIHQTEWEAAREELMQWEESDPYGYLLGLMPSLLNDIKRLAMPGFVPVWNWLGVRLKDVPCEHPGIVHGDFHPGNVLLPAAGPPVIIDWGGATIGDPRKDLAWTMLLVGAYEESLRATIFAEYSRQGGILLEGFDYFEVLTGLIRLLFIVGSPEFFVSRLKERDDFVTEMIKLAEHIDSTHQLLAERTGITVPEVLEFLRSLPGSV